MNEINLSVKSLAIPSLESPYDPSLGQTFRRLGWIPKEWHTVWNDFHLALRRSVLHPELRLLHGGPSRLLDDATLQTIYYRTHSTTFPLLLPWPPHPRLVSTNGGAWPLIVSARACSLSTLYSPTSPTSKTTLFSAVLPLWRGGSAAPPSFRCSATQFMNYTRGKGESGALIAAAEHTKAAASHHRMSTLAFVY